MKNKIFITILFSFLFCLMAVNFVFASQGGNTEEIKKLNEEIAERKQKIEEIEKNIEVYRKEIDKKKTEAQSLQNQMAILDNNLARVGSDIELTETKIDKAQLEINALELNIEDKENTIQKQKKIVKNVIQELNFQDQKNYLEILLTNSDFSEFYDQYKYLENIYTDLGKSVKTLRLSKEELDQEKKTVESKRKVYQDLKIELVNKRKDLEEQNDHKEYLLIQTKSSELRYKTLLANLKEQYKQVEDEIRNYEAQVRRKLEEKKGDEDLGIEEDFNNLYWPVPSKYITAYFHDKTYLYRNVFEHNAIDLRAAQGTPVKAAASGYVGRTRYCDTSSCYSYILLVHMDGFSTAYGHLSKISVSQDGYVNKGDIIGYSGGMPGTVGAGLYTTGPHLHFEVRKNGIPVNPLNYMSD